MIDKSLNRQTLFAIAAIMFLGIALRFYQLGHQSFWHDEVLTIRSSTGSFMDVVIDPPVNTNIPPFYYAIVNLLLNFGGSESWVRFPSAFFGVLSIFLFFCVCRNWLGSKHALIGAALFAISPLHIWYSQEARPYALLILLAMLSLFLLKLLVARKDNGWIRIGFILLSTATFYCHTVAIAFLAFLGIYILFVRRLDLKYWMLNFSIVGLLMIPAVLKMLDMPPNASANPFESFNPFSVAYAFWTFSVGFTLGPTVSELHLPNRFDLVTSQLPLILPVMVVFCSIFTFGLYKLYKSDKSTFWLIAMWFLFPLGLAVLGAVFTTHPFNVRYAILAFPPFVIGLAEGILRLSNKWFRIAAGAAIVGISLLSVKNYHYNEKYHREDTRSAVAFLDEQALPGDLVVSSAAYMVHDLNHYGNRNDLIIRGYPIPRKRSLPAGNGELDLGVESAFFVNPNMLETELLEMIGDRKRFWLFLSRTFHSDPNGSVRKFCDNSFQRAVDKAWVGTELTLYMVDF